MKSEAVDILIIGAGPAGLSAAAEAVYHEVGSVLVLEKGGSHSTTILQYYPDDKRVDANYRGQEAICAGVLCFRDTTKQNFLNVVGELLRRYHFPVACDSAVDSVKQLAGGDFMVSTTTGKSHRARFVIVAIGRMGKPNRPKYFNQIPASLRQRVHFDTRNLDAAGKDILVVGGGNSAVEFALSLATRGRVVLSYRKAEFSRLNPMNLSLLEADERIGKIAVRRCSNIAAIGERHGKLAVRFEEGSEEAFDHVVYGIGGSSPAAFLQGAGILLDGRGNPTISPELETSVPNLYVVGELAVPPGKGSIIASFNSGKVAVESIAAKLEKGRKPELVSVTR